MGKNCEKVDSHGVSSSSDPYLPCSLSGRAGLGNAKAVVPDTSPEFSLGSVCQGGTDTCHPSLPRFREYHSQGDVSSHWEAQSLDSARTTSVFSTELPRKIAFGQRVAREG